MQNRELIEKARALVERKRIGDISPELFGDQAQCMLAPLAHELEAALTQLELARSWLYTCDRFKLSDQIGTAIAMCSEKAEAFRASLISEGRKKDE